MFWKNNKCGFGMNHISCVVFHMATCLLWFSTEISMTNLPVRLLDHNFAKSNPAKKKMRKKNKQTKNMITQNDFQPSAAIWRHRCFRWNHTCLRDLSLLRLWSSSSGGRTLSGSLAKVCLKGNIWLICFMRQFKCPISNKIPLQIGLSKPYFN